ncbi:MAG TPA: PHB depolymerase family esterase [Pseudomonadota bacterium]|nr:PHB depolymerase family esterase [Pseudomonadota bacterium]
MRGLLLACLLAFVGCGNTESERVPENAPFAILPVQNSKNVAEFSPHTAGPLDGRPYQYRVPSRYDKTKPTPLLLMLHGFSASGNMEEIYLNFSALAESKTFLYAFPDGTQNPVGLRFWNAMEWCCNFFKSSVDDVAYIRAVIADMQTRFNVDPKRIFVFGHSNGGFMSHRIACELSDTVAGIASLAGQQWNDPTRCTPKQHVPILHIHGTLDAVIAYPGMGGLYPGAKETVQIWAQKNGCGGRLTYSGDKKDLDAVLLGAETTVEKYTGCPADGPVELWSIQAGGHLPVLGKHFSSSVYDFFMAHPKP